MDIRLCTRVIIRKETEFLVGYILYADELRWSISPWDAWMTRDAETARKLTQVTGGELWLFNPVAGQLKKM